MTAGLRRAGRCLALVEVCLLAGFFVSASRISAQRLPLKSYTVADGLPNNVINKIVRDSRGFLWFCTGEGLSRFDGYAFTNYGVDHDRGPMGCRTRAIQSSRSRITRTSRTSFTNTTLILRPRSRRCRKKVPALVRSIQISPDTEAVEGACRVQGAALEHWTRSAKNSKLAWWFMFP